LPSQGFTAQALILELSLFLPEDLTRAALIQNGRGGQGRPQGTSPGGAANGAQASPAPRSGPGQVTRDPKLFLTKDQVSRLLPIVQGLKDNPMPSPSKARQIAESVNAILTSAQKAEYESFQKTMAKAREAARQQRSGAAGQAQPDFRNMTDQQRQDWLNSLPPDQRQQMQQRIQQAGGPGLTQIQRRQRLMDIFLQVLEQYQKQLG
jgi:hypothetical protein